MMLTILGIAGSLRRGSHNRALLRAAQSLAPEGTRLEIADIDGIPLFNQDLERQPPAAVVDLKARIRAADAILFATPEYNHSIPGVLKNAIDWASRPYGDSAWAGKPAAVMGASSGASGTMRAQAHLRQIFVTLDMPAVNQPQVAIANAAATFDADGNLTDQAAQQLIVRLLQNLATLTRKLKAP
ncbi:MAG TPA: NAD(P)H-dependent oxidoreductase [Rhizomicrobium sp.]|nr:NAD(P)H-dependent oxidoreductase [Rhizomicrobium sp.]